MGNNNIPSMNVFSTNIQFRAAPFSVVEMSWADDYEIFVISGDDYYELDRNRRSIYSPQVILE